MTDITKLAKRLKAAAVRAQAATEEYASQRISSTAFRLEIEEFESLANKPANAIALVDALVDALRHANLTDAERQAYLGLITKRDERITELAESHSQVIQSRDHYKRMTEEGLKRLAESRTVTVKLPAERFCPAEYEGTLLWSETEVWNKAISACNGALRTAGIKVEAE